MSKLVYVENISRKIETLPLAVYCDTFLTQLRGLTFKHRLLLDEGVILVGRRDSRLDSSIHMLFVSFDLTVVWINSSMKVVDKVLARSWRPAYFSKQPAKFVLEIHPSHWEDYDIGETVRLNDA